jgi:hypothetical protein
MPRCSLTSRFWNHIWRFRAASSKKVELVGHLGRANRHFIRQFGESSNLRGCIFAIFASTVSAFANASHTSLSRTRGPPRTRGGGALSDGRAREGVGARAHQGSLQARARHAAIERRGRLEIAISLICLAPPPASPGTCRRTSRPARRGRTFCRWPRRWRTGDTRWAVRCRPTRPRFPSCRPSGSAW